MSTDVSSKTPGDPGPTTPAAQPQVAGGAAAPPAKMSRESVTVIGTLLVATFVVILNETIMNVALQRLMVDLGVTAPTPGKRRGPTGRPSAHPVGRRTTRALGRAAR